MTDAECVEVLAIATESSRLYQQYRDDLTRDIVHALGVPPYLLGVHMTDADALRAVCEEQPLDDTPRLVLADWYDNHGRPDDALAQRLDVSLRKVLADPDDDLPRLEYAEICRGYGRLDRAEFIECQVELAKRDSGDRCWVCGWPFAADAESGCVPGNCSFRPDKRSDEYAGWKKQQTEYHALQQRASLYLPGNGYRWCDELIGPGWKRQEGTGQRSTVEARFIVAYFGENEPHRGVMAGFDIRFARGFVESVGCSWADAAAHLDKILAAAPVTEVTLTDTPRVTLTPGADGFRLATRDGRLVGQSVLARWDHTSHDGRARALLAATWPQVKTWNLPLTRS